MAERRMREIKIKGEIKEKLEENQKKIRKKMGDEMRERRERDKRIR